LAERISFVTNDIEKTLGRKGKDFSDYIRKTAATGVGIFKNIFSFMISLLQKNYLDYYSLNREKMYVNFVKFQ
jgi:hypothetical protein